jgi:hypothetical protein
MKTLPRECFLIVVSLVFATALHASDTCGEEVKLLLSPEQVLSTATSLKAAKQRHTQIYFYDTPQLDLLAKGLILRIRQGADNDFTVKLRLASEQQFSARAKASPGFKCEGEVIDGVERPSYSIPNNYVASSVPETGNELFPLLNEPQRQLLEASGIVVDWTHVRRVIVIHSTSWTVHSQSPPLGKLSLELWEWPNGKSLEISTKVPADAGSSAFVELKDLAKRNHLDLSSDQRSKTATALQFIAK